MAFVATSHTDHYGQVVANGHCARHVQVAAGCPHTSTWRPGVKVRDHPELAPGTAIATFNAAGRYANATDGSSHAAILLDVRDDGLRVADQWVGKPVSERLIRFKGGAGKPCDDGDAYHTIEVA